MSAKTTICLLLLMAAFFGGLDGMPAQAAPLPERSASGHVTARLIGTDVVIDAVRLHADHAFFVKARRQVGYRWARLGAATTGNDGRLHGRYPLPKELRKAPLVRVCLKDIYTDDVFCTDARR